MGSLPLSFPPSPTEADRPLRGAKQTGEALWGAQSVVDNPDLHHFATTRQEDSKVDTGPAVGATARQIFLWMNYSLGGLAVRGYHLMNLLLHRLVGQTLPPPPARGRAALPRSARDL